MPVNVFNTRVNGLPARSFDDAVWLAAHVALLGTEPPADPLALSQEVLDAIAAQPENLAATQDGSNTFVADGVLLPPGPVDDAGAAPVPPIVQPAPVAEQVAPVAEQVAAPIVEQVALAAAGSATLPALQVPSAATMLLPGDETPALRNHRQRLEEVADSGTAMPDFVTQLHSLTALATSRAAADGAVASWRYWSTFGTIMATAHGQVSPAQQAEMARELLGRPAGMPAFGQALLARAYKADKKSNWTAATTAAGAPNRKRSSGTGNGSGGGGKRRAAPTGPSTKTCYNCQTVCGMVRATCTRPTVPRPAT